MIRDILSPALERLEALLVRELLSPTAQGQYAQGAIAKRELAPYAEAIADLSSQYVENRAPKTISKTSAAAYALYYTPINFAKLLRLLSKLPTHVFDKEISVLDYGCGPGTGTLAAAEIFRSGVSVTAWDRSEPMLEVGRALTQKLCRERANFSVEFTRQSSDFENRTFDIIIAANFLNELSVNEQQKAASKLLRLLSPEGFLVLLEPALKTPTQNLMHLRDSLVGGENRVTPIFPCSHAEKCPMLAHDKEGWCHGEIRWEEPALVHALDELVGFNKHRIKFSGFIFSRKPVQLNALTVVSPPTKNRIGSTATLCGANNFGQYTLAKKARSEGNKAFEDARLFDRLVFSSDQAPGSMAKETVVTIVADVRTCSS